MIMRGMPFFFLINRPGRGSRADETCAVPLIIFDTLIMVYELVLG